MTLTTQTGGAGRALLGTPDPDALAVARAVFGQVRPVQAILFGSRARGDYLTESDIDIAVITADPVPEDRRLEIDGIAKRAAALHPNAPSTDVSFLTVAELLAGRVKKNTLANSIAKEGKPIMDGSPDGHETGDPEEPVNWDDVDARITSALEAVTGIEILVDSARSPERLIGYAAQQALEHAYKALIAAHGEAYPTGGRDGHNLRILANRVQEVMGHDFQVPGTNWQSLTAYAGSGRYVDDQPPLGDRQRMSREISAAVDDIIGRIPQRG